MTRQLRCFHIYWNATFDAVIIIITRNRAAVNETGYNRRVNLVKETLVNIAVMVPANPVGVRLNSNKTSKISKKIDLYNSSQ